MTRECQVRICERLGVRLPGPTRQRCGVGPGSLDHGSRRDGAIPTDFAIRAFFKAQANVVNEMPDPVITNLDPALVQFRQQLAAGDIRLLFDTSAYPCFFIGQRERLLAAHRQSRRAGPSQLEEITL